MVIEHGRSRAEYTAWSAAKAGVVHNANSNWRWIQGSLWRFTNLISSGWRRPFDLVTGV